MYKKFTSFLYYKIALLVFVFSILLIALVFVVVDYYYTDQDTIRDAHELYFYYALVDAWDFPADTNKIKNEILNLHCSLSIYSDIDSSLVWAFPRVVNPKGYIIDSDSDVLGKIHDIDIPGYVSYGFNDFGDNLTSVKRGDLHYFLSVEQDYTSEYFNYLPPVVLLLLFMFGLNYFIQHTLQPIKLMKKRIYSLRAGDLKSQVPIISNDELAELSKAINKMTGDIQSLLGEKQQLLLDVGHELRSPMARMRLLIEMIPEHKNQKKLIDEIVFLEGMVSNLLLSDKLSMPYSNLECENIKIDHLLVKVLDLVGAGANRIVVNNSSFGGGINLDETKMIVAIRNIIDNAIKYSDVAEMIFIDVSEKRGFLSLAIKSCGQEIHEKEKDDIFKPFFRSQNNKSGVSGFGLGLTICKKIVVAHGGKLNVNINGKETTFVVEIPIKK